MEKEKADTSLKALEKEKVGALLKALEKDAGQVLFSMNNFRNLWKDLIYNDYKRNDFKTFGKCTDLHTSIYFHWKERSDIYNKTQQNLKRILEELEIVKTTRKINSHAVTEVNREVQEFSEASKSFKIEKYAFESLIECCKEDINVEATRTMQAGKIQQPLNNTLEVAVIDSHNLITKGKKKLEYIFIRLMELSSFFPTMTNSSCNRSNDTTKTYSDLSTIYENLIIMNSTLMFFDRSVSSMIETAKDYFTDANLGKPCRVDIQIERLIWITQEIQSLFRIIQDEISQNESLALDLVLTCNSGSLIDK